MVNKVTDITKNLKPEDADIIMPIAQYEALMLEVQARVDAMPDRTVDELAQMALEIAMTSTQIEGEGEEVEGLRSMCKTGAAGLLYINMLHVAVTTMQLRIKELQEQVNSKLH